MLGFAIVQPINLHKIFASDRKWSDGINSLLVSFLSREEHCNWKGKNDESHLILQAVEVISNDVSLSSELHMFILPQSTKF